MIKQTLEKDLKMAVQNLGFKYPTDAVLRAIQTKLTRKTAVL